MSTEELYRDLAERLKYDHAGLENLSRLWKAMMIEAIRAYALKNYESDGWDYVVESFEDNYLSELIGDAKTLEQAIQNIKDITTILKERESW